MVTIGQKLGDARREAGLSVEAIAHDTKIHSTMIRAIEDDDFSMFPSVAYARSFISKYASVLGIDLSDSLKALNSGVTLQLSDHELMGEMKNTIKKDSRFRRERTPRALRKPRFKAGGRPLLLNLILVTLIGAMAVFYFLGFHAHSPEQAQENITKGLQGANPFDGEEEELPEFPLAKEIEQPSDSGPARPQLTYVDGDIEKPEVDLELDDRPQPSEAITKAETPALPLRETPAISLDPVRSSGPITTSDLPALRKPTEEPAAILRPEGTDPVQEQEPGEPAPTRPIRAIPVAGGGNR